VCAQTTVAVAGATGFVGRAFCDAYRARYDLVGISRSARESAADHGPHHWRSADLFSLLQVEQALEGCKVAVYLVHSMMPRDRLTQADFADLDLILADNFGRAAARSGVEKIVYLGGLIPETNRLSRHLASRREVEDALAAHGVPVTTLRAGLVVGPGGSSFEMLHKLVQRLPAMLCPRWTSTPTQPIALADIVQLIAFAIDDDRFDGQACDVGGPDVITYRDMIADVAALTDRRRLLLPAPLFSPRLSRLWVSLVTGTSRALVGPLVESLRHPMVASERRLQQAAGVPGIRWKAMLEDALTGAPPAAPPRSSTAGAPPPSTVRSVQRLARPPAASAPDVADAYLTWLPRALWHLLRVEADQTHARFFVRPWSRPLLELELSEARSTVDRTLFYVTGGALARDDDPPGRLEFRIAPDGENVLAAVHDFRPRLPWFIYRWTQAVVHRAVMAGFDRHLRRLPGGSHRRSLESASG